MTLKHNRPLPDSGWAGTLPPAATVAAAAEAAVMQQVAAAPAGPGRHEQLQRQQEGLAAGVCVIRQRRGISRISRGVAGRSAGLAPGASSMLGLDLT